MLFITLKSSRFFVFLLFLSSITVACNGAYPEKEGKKMSPVLHYQISSKKSAKIGEPVQILIKLTNNSDQDIKLLKWGTAIEAFMTRDMLSITMTGKNIPYQGRMVKRGKPTANDYITIKAKQTIQRKLNVSQAYPIDKVGQYTIKYKNSLLKLKATSKEKSLIEIAPSNQTQILITN